MKKQVIKQVLNVIVEKKGSKVSEFNDDDDFPDADALGQKYDLSIYGSPDSPASKAQFHQQIQDNSDFVNRTEQLLSKLDQKNLELDRLCTLIEAMEPVPGIDPDRLRRHIDGTADNDPLVDYRDAKIVALAKKCRKLQVFLNKERVTAESRGSQLDEVSKKCDRLENELRVLASKASGTGSSKSAGGGGGGGDSPAASLKLQKDLSMAIKEMNELRRREYQMGEEVKSLNRALANELGDGVTVEQSLAEGGWRGRAQQIVMMKAKIRRLEAGLTTNASVAATGVTGMTSAAGNKYSKRNDVDSKAEAELANMSNDRKQAVEMITEDRDRLTQDNQQLETKNRALKSRIQNLENDAVRSKEQIKIVIEKSNSDDQLIDSLREEVEKLKQQVKIKAAAATAATGGAGAGTQRKLLAMVPARAPQDPDTALELQRLKRLCKQQAEQLATQEEMIKQLRSSSSSKK